MPKSKSTNVLDIYLNRLLVGHLRQTTDGGMLFSYSPYWIQHHSDFAISRQIPVRERPYAGALALNYFDNLLPDVKTLRERVAQESNAKSTRVFDLLQAVGGDCVGALQFLPAPAQVPTAKIQAKKVSPLQIARILKNLKFHPLGIIREDDFRISLAGAQEKTALLYMKGSWHRPFGSTPTTHIFKPSLGIINDDVDMRTSVENEWLCLKICELFRLRTANADIKSFAGTKVLAVERFDRIWSKRRLLRLPQEDMCQALGFSTAQKYQCDGGPGVFQIVELLKESNESKRDIYDFLKTQIVFWLLAAIDGHAKNFSVQIVPSGFELCPLYDVLSAYPAISRRQLNKNKIKMAMKVGKNEHYRHIDICKRHWLQLDDLLRLRVGTMQSIVNEVRDELPRVLYWLQNKIPSTIPNSVSEPIISGIKKTALRLD